jgi:hypothetical protein
MVQTKIQSERRDEISSSHAGLTCDFRQIEEPGCYVDHETGRLFRIPNDALAQGRSPVIDTVGNSPWLLTKVSDDPYAPLSKVRMAAADLDLPVNF